MQITNQAWVQVQMHLYLHLDAFTLAFAFKCN
jgi:hypothetical protein